MVNRHRVRNRVFILKPYTRRTCASRYSIPRYRLSRGSQSARRREPDLGHLDLRQPGERDDRGMRRSSAPPPQAFYTIMSFTQLAARSHTSPRTNHYPPLVRPPPCGPPHLRAALLSSNRVTPSPLPPPSVRCAHALRSCAALSSAARAQCGRAAAQRPATRGRP